MKRIILFGIVAMFFLACQQQEQRYFAESNETKTLQAGIAAYESGDWTTWKTHFADTAKVFVNSKEGITADARLEQLKAAAQNFKTYH